MAMGEKNADPKAPGWSRDENVSGRKVEVPYLGQARTITGVTDGAQELAAATLNQIAGQANMEFDVAHYPHTVPIQNSLITRVQEGNLKAGSFFDMVFEQVKDSYFQTFATALNATAAGNTAPAQNRLGSVWHAVSDGTEVDYAVYGTIDRSDAANAVFRGILRAAEGTLTLDKLAAGQIAVQANGGRCDFGVAGTVVFGRVRSLLEGKHEGITATGGLLDFSGPRLRYAGVDYGLDSYAPAQHLLQGDSRTWMTKRTQKAPLTSGGIVPMTGILQAAHAIFTEWWVQVICSKARHNVKHTGITG